MKSAASHFGLPSRRTSLYLLAIVLPVLASGTTEWFTALHRVPYALNLLVIAAIAIVGGTLPSVVAVGATVIARFVFMAMSGQQVPLNLLELARIVIVLSIALLISLMTGSRRKAQAELEVAHLALQERTDALSESLHSSKCASWTLDAECDDGPRWYSGSYHIFGRPFSEAEDLDSFIALLHPEDRRRIAALIQQLKTTADPVLWEFRAPWPNGELHWFEMRATRVPDSTVWRGLTVDITDRKLAESALLRSEKLAAMGRLASTVAHEINNPLEAVTNLLYLARADPALEPETAAYLATAETELARLGNITRLTLGFVRASSIPRSIEVAAIAEEVLSIFRHRLERRGVKIERSYQPEVAIQIAPHELRQILTNLISNATDAMDGAESKIGIRIQSHGNFKALVIVEDNGTGISPTELPRIFEPFFTTKHDIGTGIGLWVTRELVESNGGRISAESGALRDGIKTRFTIEFPAAVS